MFLIKKIDVLFLDFLSIQKLSYSLILFNMFSIFCINI